MAGIDLDIITNVSDSIKQIEGFSEKSTKALQGIESGFKNLGTSADDFAGKAQKSAGGFSSGLQAASAAAAGLLAFFSGKAIINFFSEAVSSAAGGEFAVQKLNIALANSGSFSKQASQDMQEFAGSLQQTTGFSDDETLSLLALAKSFGISNEKAKEIVKTAVDLEGRGIDARTSVEGLSKGMLGFKSSLEKALPEISGLTKAQKANGDQIAILAEKYKGTASDLTNTFSGAVKLVGVNYGELVETIGQTITQNPFVVGAIRKLSDGLVELGEFASKNKKEFIELNKKGIIAILDIIPDLVSGFAKVVVAFQSIGGTISIIKIGLGSFAELSINFAETIINIFAQLGAEVFKPVIAQILGVATAMNSVQLVSDETLKGIQDLSDSTNDIADNGTKAFDDLKKSVQSFTNSAQNDFDSTTETISKTEKGFRLLKGGAQKLVDSVKDLGDGTNNASNAFEKISENAKVTTVAFEDQEKELDKLRSSYSDLQKDLEKARNTRNPIEGIKQDEQNKLNVLKESIQAGLVLEEEAAKVRQEIGINAQLEISKETARIDKERLELQRKQQEEFITSIKKATAEGLASPLITSSQADEIFGPSKPVDTETAGVVGQSVGLIGAALEGAAGATKLIQAGFAAIAESIVPGIGGAVGGIIGLLAQGPEKVKAIVEEFAAAFPEILKNINLAIPVIIETLADHAPEIIIAIVKSIPEIITAIIKAIPEIAKALLVELPQALGDSLVEELSTELSSGAIKTAFDEFVEDVGRIGRQFTDEVQEASVSFKNDVSDAGEKFASDTSITGKIFGAQLSDASKIFGAQVSDASKIFGAQVSDASKIFGLQISEEGKGLANNIGNAGTTFFTGMQSFIDTFLIGTIGRKLKDDVGDTGKIFGAQVSDASKIFGAQVSDASKTFGAQISDTSKTFGAQISNASKTFGAQISDTSKTFGLQISKEGKGLADNIGNAGTTFFKGMESFILGVGDQLGVIGQTLIDAVIKGISDVFTPFENVYTDITNGIFDAIKAALGGKSLNVKALFATGGEVPAGFPNDTFRAGLTSGENVIDRSLSERLEKFLTGQSGQQSTTQGPIKVVLQVGEKQLADVMLNISRQGFRTI